MSSDARPIQSSTEHTGSTPGSSRGGGVISGQVSTAPTAEVVATPIYDELAARFDLPRGRAGEGHGTGSIDVEHSPAA
ncbi:hypothetical protein IOD16_23810 [Saccharothrix sp. 6-C]|uniref:hypothetical protein n=1 Tax=Saccharothrix sp. 6-C TaxID=2781735 RepID=UPI001917147D|nr:hypothetical protein [Saccharothrix sp. 6-C]QQQ74223.1 hypothetical protein IOD16_23810 [Saccharothrix sp. 6-C]